MSWRAATAASAAVALAAVALAGCGATQSPAAAVSSWANDNSVGAAVADLYNDSLGIVHAIGAHEAGLQIRTDCQEALQNALGANGDLLPTPDTRLTDLLSNAIDQFAHLDGQCSSASATNAVLASVVVERRAAVGALQEAVLREEAVTGSPLHIAGPS